MALKLPVLLSLSGLNICTAFMPMFNTARTIKIITNVDIVLRFKLILIIKTTPALTSTESKA